MAKAEISTAATSAPLRDDEFKRLFWPLHERLGRPFALAVALSGGPDSTALTALLKAWAEAHQVKLTALIVDHGLRPEAAAEADSVAAFWRTRGLACEILRWEHAKNGKPSSGIQERARKARWALMLDWCRVHGVGCLVTGQHMQDQAETVLMRLAKGSGPAGLAAMRPIQSRAGVRVLRPLLEVAKERLIATCKAQALPFVEDPSNQDSRFLRARLREAEPALEALGLTAEALAMVAEKQAEFAGFIERSLIAAAGQMVTADPLGMGCVDLEAFRALGEALLQRELLARMAAHYAGAEHPLPTAQSEGLLDWALSVGPRASAITTGGCLVEEGRSQGAPVLRFLRELDGISRKPLTITAGERVHWDHRYEIEASSDTGAASSGWTIVPADAAIWRELSDRVPADLTKAPARLRWGLPALKGQGRSLGILAPGFLEAFPALAGWQVWFAPRRPLFRPEP